MNIEQLGREYEIIPAVQEVASLTRAVTGKDLDFQLTVNLSTDGITKIARERMPKHIVKLKENSMARLNHVVAHECGHIIRTMQAAPEDRVVPSSNLKSMANARAALESELETIQANARNEIFEIWVSGMISQLVNLPVDVRIENWLYRDYPTLRDCQNKSLAIDVQNSISGLSEKIKDNTIYTVFNRSNAMVYAYLRGLSIITGENYAEHFKKYPDIKKIGRKLFAFLEVEDTGFNQDVEIINSWAEMLEIKGWFTWIGFEEVPETYYTV